MVRDFVTSTLVIIVGKFSDDREQKDKENQSTQSNKNSENVAQSPDNSIPFWKKFLYETKGVFTAIKYEY